MVGGNAPQVHNERLIRFFFPERPGALLNFMDAMRVTYNFTPVPVPLSRGGLRPRAAGGGGARGTARGLRGVPGPRGTHGLSACGRDGTTRPTRCSWAGITTTDAGPHGQTVPCSGGRSFGGRPPAVGRPEARGPGRSFHAAAQGRSGAAGMAAAAPPQAVRDLSRPSPAAVPSSLTSRDSWPNMDKTGIANFLPSGRTL